MFGWIKWECPGKNSDWPSFGHKLIPEPISVAGDWGGLIGQAGSHGAGERWSQPYLNYLEVILYGRGSVTQLLITAHALLGEEDTNS